MITTRTCTWLVPSSRFGWLHFRGQWGCRGAEEDQRWRGVEWHSHSQQSLQAVRRLRGSRPDLGGRARAGVLRAAGSKWSRQDHHLQDADWWCHGHCRQCFCQTAQHQDGHQTGGWDFSGWRYLWLELSPNVGWRYLWLELSPNVGCYLWLELFPNTLFFCLFLFCLLEMDVLLVEGFCCFEVVVFVGFLFVSFCVWFFFFLCCPRK